MRVEYEVIYYEKTPRKVLRLYFPIKLGLSKLVKWDVERFKERLYSLVIVTRNMKGVNPNDILSKDDKYEDVKIVFEYPYCHKAICKSALRSYTTEYHESPIDCLIQPSDCVGYCDWNEILLCSGEFDAEISDTPYQYNELVRYVENRLYLHDSKLHNAVLSELSNYFKI